MSRLNEVWMTPSIRQLYSTLTEDCEAEKVLRSFYPRTAQDSTLARIYDRLQFPQEQSDPRVPLTPSAVKNIIYQETLDLQTDHYLAGSDILTEERSLRPLHHELRESLRATFRRCGMEALTDFEDIEERAESDEDWASLSVIWTEDAMCEAAAKHCSPRTSCSSGTDASFHKPFSGLRPLACRVRELVKSSSGKATYQSVSEGLLSEIESCSTEARVKTIKNVRRRVYDAINVMVAAGVFERCGDCISVTQRIESCESESLHARIQAKKARLRALASTYQCLKSLAIRNEKHSAAATDRLPLPFLVVATPDRPGVTVNHMQIRIVTDPNNHCINLKSSSLSFLFGDLDALQRLRLPRLAVLPEGLTSLYE